MARGVVCTGASAEEAEAPKREQFPQLTVLRSRRIDVSDLRAEWRTTVFPPDNCWIVVVEDPDPSNAPLPQQEDQEAETEAQFRADMVRALRQLYGRAA
jgi:hypothetical protein